MEMSILLFVSYNRILKFIDFLKRICEAIQKNQEHTTDDDLFKEEAKSLRGRGKTIFTARNQLFP